MICIMSNLKSNYSLNYSKICAYYLNIFKNVKNQIIIDNSCVLI